MAPGKLAPSDNFEVIFQVAHNPLKFAMSTLFVKNVPVFCFSRGQKIWTKLHANPTPPPPPPLCLSPNNVGFRSLRASVCVHVSYWGGGGVQDREEAVWTFKNMFEALFPCLREKKNRDIFSQKKSLHGKYQWILSNLENCYGFVTWGRLLRTPLIILSLWSSSHAVSVVPVRCVASHFFPLSPRGTANWVSEISQVATGTATTLPCSSQWQPLDWWNDIRPHCSLRASMGPHYRILETYEKMATIALFWLWSRGRGARSELNAKEYAVVI